MGDAINNKICPRCKIEKSLTEFYARRDRPGGLVSRCRACANEDHRNWVAKNREKIRSDDRGRRTSAPKGIQHITEGAKLRFHTKYKATDKGECWEWLAHRDQDGYGSFKLNYRTYRASRISYFLHYGKDPGVLETCHRCDNPPCVNPHHLFLGTSLDNNRDKVAKGRSPLGVKNGRYTHPESTVRGEHVNTAQLTEAKVQEILIELKNGAGLTELGRKHGVCKQAIYCIREGRTWKHMKRP